MLSIFKIKTFNLNMDYYVYTDGAVHKMDTKMLKLDMGFILVKMTIEILVNA